MAGAKKAQPRKEVKKPKAAQNQPGFMAGVGEKFNRHGAGRLAQNEEWRRESREAQAQPSDLR